MISRRVFIKNGGLALVSLGFAPSFLSRAAAAVPGEGRRKVLLAIFQRGAVDGLNMVVPHGEQAYYAARPTIAIPRPGQADTALTAIDLDGFFGLHPRMSSLQPLWRDQRLAIVHACGSPDATRSHFDAQDYMESATPGVKSTQDGWLNRYLDARREQEHRTPFRAVSLTAQLPRVLQGTAPALAMTRLQQFGLQGSAAMPAGRNAGMPAGSSDSRSSSGAAVPSPSTPSFESEYAASADHVLNRTGKEAFDAIRMLQTANPAQYRPENGADYPRSGFGDALRQIAQLIKADVGLEVAFADIGGWDHHVNQGSSTGQLAQRLDDFSRALSAIATDLGRNFDDVVVLTMSEFGRTLGENGSRGTDHGHGNAMLVMGGNVRGGKVYGRWPGLAPEQRYEGRDLAITTDFRDVFGEILVRHLGVRDARPVFPGYALDPSRFPGFLAS